MQRDKECTSLQWIKYQISKRLEDFRSGDKGDNKYGGRDDIGQQQLLTRVKEIGSELGQILMGNC